MRKVIITADDLGISVGTNQAINAAHRNGVLACASLLVTMPCVSDAVENVLVQNPGLGVGLHLNLTSGSAALGATDIPDLVDHRGHFRHSFLGLCRILQTRNRQRVLEQVRAELAAQLVLFQKLGFALDHMNGHQHVHMIPGILQEVLALNRSHGQVGIRVPSEPVWLTTRCHQSPWSVLTPMPIARALILAVFSRRARKYLGGVSHPDAVFGVLDSGKVDTDFLLALVRRLPSGVSEIIVHPGIPSVNRDAANMSEADIAFLDSPDREKEFNALVDPSVVAELQNGRSELCTFQNAF